MILFILATLIFIYFCIALILFISLLVSPQNVIFTNYKTNTQYTLSGYKKILAYLLVSCLWVITIHFERR